MRTAIKILGIVGVVSGIVALRRKSQNKEVTVKGVKEDIKKSADATKKIIKDEYNEFLSDAERFVDQSTRKIKSFGAKVKDLDEKSKKSFNTKIARITVAKDKVRTKILEFKKAAEDKREGLKNDIENLKNALSLSLKTFEKEWK